jgi:hypothetical protein
VPGDAVPADADFVADDLAGAVQLILNDRAGG